MGLAGTIINAFVVAAVGAILAYLSNDRFRALRRDIESLRTETKSDIARLEARLDSGLAAVHSEIVQVALAVGARRGSAQS